MARSLDRKRGLWLFVIAVTSAAAVFATGYAYGLRQSTNDVRRWHAHSKPEDDIAVESPDAEDDPAPPPPPSPAIPVIADNPEKRRRVYNLTEGRIPTFMVSLAGSVRRKRQKHLLENSYLDIEIFEAVAGRSVEFRPSPTNPNVSYAVLLNGTLLVPYDRRPWFQFKGRALTPGQIGCSLSNYLACRMCVDENLPAMLMLEDDVKFLRSDRDIRKILSHLPPADQYDIAYVQRSIAGFELPLRRRFPATGGYWYLSQAGAGTYGYIATQRYCRSIYDTFVLSRDADGFISRWTTNHASVVLTTKGKNQFVGLWGDLQRKSDRKHQR